MRGGNLECPDRLTETFFATFLPGFEFPTIQVDERKLRRDKDSCTEGEKQSDPDEYPIVHSPGNPADSELLKHDALQQEDKDDGGSSDTHQPFPIGSDTPEILTSKRTTDGPQSTRHGGPTAFRVYQIHPA